MLKNLSLEISLNLKRKEKALIILVCGAGLCIYSNDKAFWSQESGSGVLLAFDSHP